jgi:excisionase family DNA binding protein
MIARMTPKDVARHLHIGTRAVYGMLARGQLPGLRIGQRWLITRASFERWEKTCGLEPASNMPVSTGLSVKPEVPVN